MRRRRNLLRFLTAIAVVAAGTAVVGRAAGLSLATKPLGAVQASVPTCPSGSITVTPQSFGWGRNLYIYGLRLALTSCSGAADGATLYATLDDTRTQSAGYGTCTVTGTPASCTIRLSQWISGKNNDTFSLELLTGPGAAPSTVISANHLALAPEYLTLRTCTSTGPPTTC